MKLVFGIVLGLLLFPVVSDIVTILVRTINYTFIDAIYIWMIHPTWGFAQLLGYQ